MEIRKSWGRFISIFLIVALGVAFYAGIRASEPSMRISGDAYFDKEHLMDIKVMGTMGLTEEDVEAIEDVDGIELAEGTYSMDALCNTGDTEQVVHVMAMQEHFNDVQVSEGRLPEKEGECLMDEEFALASGYGVGDTITLSSGDEDPLEDSLTTDVFEVVGIGNSPLYISFGRGSSTIGNGEVSGFIAVDPDSFCMDVYSEICVRVTDAEQEIAYTDGYTSLTDAAVDALEKIEDERCQARRQEIVDEAEGELADAQATVDEESQTLADARSELEEGRSQAARELADARQALEDAQAQLDAARQQIADGEARLAAGKEELSTQQAALDSGREQYESGMAQLEQQQAQLDASEVQYLAQYAQQMPLIEQGKQEIAAGKELLTTSISQMETLADHLSSLREELKGIEDELNSGQGKYDEILAIPPENRTQEETDYLQSWEQIKKELADRQTDANTRLSFAENMEQEALAALAEQGEDFSYESAEEAVAGLQGKMQELLAREQTLLAGEQELLAYGQQIEDGKAQLAAARQTLEDSKQQIDAGQAQIDAAWALINSQESQLASGKADLAAGEQEIAAGWSEYEQGAAQAAQEIADGEAQIADGERQLEEAQNDIAEAQAEIDKIENPQWYVQDRSSALTEYDGYGDNADRMRAIGQVFPAVFFLVAALISLTAMTRMVEEQRIQIGTLKALGYSKLSIAGKYIAYALTATLGGSVLGVLFGEKVFPWIIIYAYKIMYQHIPDILVPYHLSYAVQATLIAVLCTLAATIFSCYRELASVPAQLMRPPAPKQGQRILLERVKIIWKHLNFSWKSSIRNLVRYKKRFFMTVFGIGGCMALMVVGFGLKDCIFVIPELQYNSIQTYDAAVYFDAGISREDKEEIAALVRDESAVSGELMVRMQNLEVTAGDTSMEIYLTVPENLENVGDFLDFHSRTKPETYSLEKEQVILTEKAASDLGVEVGDTVTLEDDGMGVKEVTIDAICENYMGHYLYLSPDYYRELFGKEAASNGVLFKMKEGQTDQIEAVGGRLLGDSNVLNVSYTSSIEDRLDDMLQSLNLVIVVLIISAGMLAFIVLYNLNTINITERKRELATIKVLGFYDTEVAAYVYRENVLLTLIGAVAGMALGWVLLQFVIVTVEVDDVMFGRVLDLTSYLYSFLFTLGFSMFVNWVMYFKLKKIDMVESLKSVE
uniref:ABC transporter permease n=1 Tax=Lachnoclostridium phocaeense TaxID=1871021 RepID=UPI002F3EA9F6